MPTVRTNGIETDYVRRGDGPPVVFVHAALLDHSQWNPQVEALGDEYTTVAYDVRGHGRTGGSTLASYSIDLFAEDLDALITALDLDRPVLCGLSLGGCIAQVYATRYPGKLSGLVLADTFTPGERRWPERLQWAALRAAVPPTRLLGYERVEKVMVWIHERLRGSEAVGEYEKIEDLRSASPTVGTDEFAKVIRALVRFPRTDLDLPTVDVPTLILLGEHEPGFVRRHAARLAAEIPDARVREVPGGGHASNLDEPEFFAATLREFLQTRVYVDATEDVGESQNPGESV